MKKKFLVFLVAIGITMLCANQAMALSFSDSFEDSALNPFWDVISGPFSLSTDMAHTGNQSLKMYQGSFKIGHTFAEPVMADASIWIYDSLNPNASFAAQIFGVDTVHHDPTNGDFFLQTGLVLENDMYGFPNYLLYGPPGIGIADTGFRRTLGWHKFDFSVGADGATFQIDDQPVYFSPLSQDIFEIDVVFSATDPDVAYFDDFYMNADLGNPAVPEPASLSLLGLGLSGLLFGRKRIV